MGDLTKNFSKKEFACKCGCGFDAISPKLVEKLQGIRDHIENPIIISSGCRCENHNRLQGGHSDSAHLKGFAADILCADSASRFELLSLAVKNFARIGINMRFIHVDIDRYSFAGAGIAWVYPNKK
ncbi:MAG: hypothetical protein IH897_05760 [Planctomycetes bacterium]|nr:hypothetical protein [Planctomycetota bacterium]